MFSSSASLSTEIDVANSWVAEDLVPSGTHELALETITPRSIPIRVNKITTRTSGFLFPEAGQWLPPKIPGSAATDPDVTKKRLKSVKRTRIKPPGDIVKLQDRLFYLLQPPLDLLVGSGQLNFPFEPFPYQLDGIAFLFPRYAAVLADEMGLGKTMQAISTIRLLLCSGQARSVLLVCPKPLVSNWLREFSVWAPEIPIMAIEGNAAKRELAWRSPEIPVKVANYELLMRDKDIVLESGLHFDLVTLDEAQRIKNRNSTTAEIVRAIPRTRSWALTGTPVENSPDDLVGIFDYLQPGYLSVGMPMPEMAKRADDYILRRTKEMVMEDMPPKLYRDAELDLTSEQWATYESAEKEGVIHLEELDQQLTIQHVFELVLRLKQICNFDPVTGSSAKLERLVADMEEVSASGKKAIVFSQWVGSVEKMRPALQRFNPLEYHGKIPHKQRETVIEEIKNDPKRSVILMSYGAGSVGLNLQFCEYVFLFDRWWNPAIEDQAINRAHRIGAKGAVTVTRMLAMNTIEQRIASVLDAKREMFNTLFSPEGDTQGKPNHGGGLTRDEIFGLFDLRAPGGKKVA
jgi:SNF2 family DNA or RNA helicase